MGSDQTTPQKYTCVFGNAMHLIMLMKGLSLDKTSNILIYMYILFSEALEYILGVHLMIIHKRSPCDSHLF